SANKDGSGEAGAEFAHEWVPARNTVLLALALAYADKEGLTHIALADNLEQSGGGHPDTEQEFVNRFQHPAPQDSPTYTPITFIPPLAGLMKHEIVKLGVSEHMAFELTWSCYEGGGKGHCGECGPCYLRSRAFMMNDAVDPVFTPEQWSVLSQRGK